jgi:hypothetical protein
MFSHHTKNKRKYFTFGGGYWRCGGGRIRGSFSFIAIQGLNVVAEAKKKKTEPPYAVASKGQTIPGLQTMPRK